MILAKNSKSVFQRMPLIGGENSSFWRLWRFQIKPICQWKESLHVIKCSFFDISRGSARSHLVFGKLGGFWTGLMTAKGWCLPCCTNTNSLMNACILCSYTCVGVYCVLKGSFLKSALSIQEGTKSSHYWRKTVWQYDTQPPKDQSLMFSDWSRSSVWLALLCFSVAVGFFCVLFFFF